MTFNASKQWDLGYHQSRPALPFTGYTTKMNVWAVLSSFDETLLESTSLKWTDEMDLPSSQTWHTMTTHPYQFLSVSDGVVIRRRFITLRQMVWYDLNHPVIAPAPKYLTRVALEKLRVNGVIHPRARISQTDFYDVVDVIFAIHTRQRNGRNFDMPQIKEFWGIRLAKYAELDDVHGAWTRFNIPTTSLSQKAQGKVWQPIRVAKNLA